MMTMIESANQLGNDGEMTVDKGDDGNNDIREDNGCQKGDDIRGESVKPATTAMRVIPPHPQPKR